MVGDPSSPQYNRDEVPEVVVSRLPQYLRVLSRLIEDGTLVVSSQQLGERLRCGGRGSGSRSRQPKSEKT